MAVKLAGATALKRKSTCFVKVIGGSDGPLIERG
jgi:hypothetical protein